MEDSPTTKRFPATGSAPCDDAELVRKTRAMFDAIAEGDYSALIELTSPQIEVNLPAELPYGGVYKGHAGMARALKQVKTHWEVYEPFAEEIRPVGSHTVTLGRLTVQPPGGDSEQIPFTLFTRFDGERICCTHQYSDTWAMLRLLRD